jgi:predicted transcriptional regulator
MEKDLAESLEARKKLISIIKIKPGIHFREIHKESGLAMGELEYHLGVLVKLELISEKKSSYYTRYYPSLKLGTQDKNIMELLRQKMLRDILIFIISSDNVTHGDVASEFKILKSTVSFYMKKLIKSGIVNKEKKGRNVYYTVPEPERVLKLILVYKKGFGDELVKRVEGLWGNL